MPLKLILDTNAIVEHKYRFDGPHVAILERAIGLGGCELVVPQVVVLETRNRYREDLRKAVDVSKRAIGELNSILPPTLLPAQPTVDAEGAVQEFTVGFEARLAALREARPEFADIPKKISFDVTSNDDAPFKNQVKGTATH